MTIHWDPWHTVTVTAITNAENTVDYEDCEFVFEVEHPEPHENGCPDDCMTQQEIDGQFAEGLPTEPGTYQIRAWGEYWPANQVCQADFDGGVEVKQLQEVTQ